MACNSVLCLLLIMASFEYVTSFSVRRRHSPSTDLTDALRMLERQRRRINNEGNFVAFSLNEGPLKMAEPGSWFQTSPSSSFQNDFNGGWMVKPVGESYRLEESSPEDVQVGEFLDEPVQRTSSEVEPPTEDLENGFGEISEDEDEANPPVSVQKKDKEVMMNVVGDARPKVQTRSGTNSMDTESSENVSLTKEEFKALLKAVETLQETAQEKAEEEEAEEVMEEVQERISEAREQAREAQEEAMEAQAEASQENEGGVTSSDPLQVDEDEGLNDLFEEDSEEVIPTENGEIIKVDKTLKNSAGQPVGREETVEELQTFPEEGDSFSPVEDLWYVKNYIDEESMHRKRNSKRDFIPTSWKKASSPQKKISSELIEAYVNKISELEADLDQAQVTSYLEDVENDFLTEALDRATLAQLRPGQLALGELRALRDAIRVEELLQQVKADRTTASEIANELADEQFNEEDDEEENGNEYEKRGEPWGRRSDAMQPEIPVYVMDDDNDVLDDVGDYSEGETTDLAVRGENDDEDKELDDDNDDDDLIGEEEEEDVAPQGIASLFSDRADRCPAVRAFSTNCGFAGNTIDFQARALCNLHEMCYVCGHSLATKQSQCDFVYRAAAAMLCEEDRQCVLDSELFLNTMKLKHRFVPYSQPICLSYCTAEFLSIV